MTSSGRSRKQLTLVVIGLVVLVLIFAVVLPRFANYGDVWRVLTSMKPGWLIALGAAEIANLGTYAPNWMAALPGLRYRQSLELTMAGTAIANVAPLGGPVSMTMQYGMLRQWGFARRDSSRAMVLTGIWNNLLNLSLPVVALVVLTAKGGKNAALAAAARIGAPLIVLGVVGFIAVMRSERAGDVVGGWADRTANVIRRVRRRPPSAGAASAIHAFRADSVDLIRRRWLALTVGTLVGVMTMFVVFVICIRGLDITGQSITFTEAFAAWAISRLLSSIPLTPGGLGIIEVGLTSALTAFGADQASAVAAVLLYRLLTWLPPILLGGVAALTWRRNHSSVQASV